jgi:hypothetical protein
MKQCPSCRRTFSDDTLVYCLEDGSALGNAYDTSATQIMPPPRVTSPPPAQFAPYNPPPPQPQQQRTYMWLIVLLASGLLVCLVAAGAVIAWINIRNTNRAQYQSASPASQITTNNNQRDATNSNTSKKDKDSSSSSTETSPSLKLVGVWRTNVFELGVNAEITCTFLANGISQYKIREAKGRTETDHGTWQYTDGILYEKFSNGASGKGSIEWIDNDTVVQTIIDNGVPAYKGLKRRYRRIG